MSYFVANWKMYGNQALVSELAQAMPESSRFDSIVICPPAPLLDRVNSVFSCEMGGQDCSPYEHGAYTGDVSAPMLKDLGCSYVILGHSERRQHHGEKDVLVKAKAEAAMKAGLTPIICVGETLAEREGGFVLEVLEKQVAASIPDSGDYLIAYEPVWAIGTGHTPSLEQIEAAHAHIKQVSGGAAVLYGGSVKPANLDEILTVQTVDGVLVGSASIDSESFRKMIEK